MTSDHVHPFTATGHGTGPFRVVRCYEKIYQACPEAPVQGAGRCEHCCQGIRWCYVIRDLPSGHEFVVGCDCALKADRTYAPALRTARREYVRAERERVSLAAQRERNGGLTDREVREAREEGRRAAVRWLEAERKAAQRWIGEVGKRSEMVVRIVRKLDYSSPYRGTKMLNVLDLNGSTLVWWQTGCGIGRVGDTVRIKATIKGHDTYRGEKQTTIQRATRIETLSEAPEIEAGFGRRIAS